MASTDEELVARSRGGDLDSFNQLVVRWERPIYALAYRVIGREEDARDVAQETFLRAFRALGGFKGMQILSCSTGSPDRVAMEPPRRRAPAPRPPMGSTSSNSPRRRPAESIEDLVARRALCARGDAMAMLPTNNDRLVLKYTTGLSFSILPTPRLPLSP